MNKGNAPLPGPWFSKFGTVTVGVVLFLILVGGIVRSTGSGMGCPDWPKCFGSWVPPTDVSEIPESFFESHPDYRTMTFNAAQTWTEYINRLIGALTGFFVFITAVLSWAWRRRDLRITVLSITAVLLTGFQGWLGKVVVDKNLSGPFVTLHMLVALIILAMLITAVYLARRNGAEPVKKGTGYLIPGFIATGITAVQILIGTQVRERVDEVAALMDNAARDTWVDQLGTWFSVHRAFWIVAGIMIVLWVRVILRDSGEKWVKGLAYALLITLFAEVALGIILSTFALPPVIQPVHMLLAGILFSLEYLLLIHGLRIEGYKKENWNRGQMTSFADAKH